MTVERNKLERSQDAATRTVVDGERVLSYFGQRRESELVLDPAGVRDVEPVLRPFRRSRACAPRAESSET